MKKKAARPAPGATALALAAVTVLSLLLSSCYETREGLRYLSLISKARDIDRVIADPRTSGELRLFLERAAAARGFALAEIGLKETRNYRSVVELDADRLATIVQACGELSFERYLWSYPLVGKMPYRGFFDPKDAEKEAALLRKKGLDVIVRPTGAFSTLGWLPDPLFSFQAAYDEAETADLVIHEMTHATVFLKGKGAGASQFNEELATFVGREGALRYLAKAHGAGSREVAEAKAGYADDAAFAAYLAGTAKLLEAVYASGSSEGEKRRRKAEVIAARAEEYARDYPSLFKGDRYEGFDMGKINNAYLDMYRLYEGESALYGDFCSTVCQGDIRLFVATVARIAHDAATRGDPKAEMRRELIEAGSAR
jgi:predicted aminopeptidase